jgi:hypothetical protein
VGATARDVVAEERGVVAQLDVARRDDLERQAIGLERSDRTRARRELERSLAGRAQLDAAVGVHHRSSGRGEVEARLQVVLAIVVAVEAVVAGDPRAIHRARDHRTERWLGTDRIEEQVVGLQSDASTIGDEHRVAPGHHRDPSEPREPLHARVVRARLHSDVDPATR